MSRKLKLGVFGAHRGKTMIRVLLKHPDAELVAICDKYEPLLNEAGAEAEKAGLRIALYTDFEAFFEHDMDAVVLANYANEHAPFAIRLLLSGRHVLSEVLPVETMAQAVMLIEAAEKSGKVYAYAENYCYMLNTFEMWRRYEAGEIGEATYAEGEYVHDCSSIWPQITYGERDHWRNRMYSTYYCTHSLGPIIRMTGLRPVSVTGFETRMVIPDSETRLLGNQRGTDCAGLELVTLENGALIKSLHGTLKREPGSVNYVLYGAKGMMETERFDSGKLNVYREGDKLCVGEREHYAPAHFVASGIADAFGTHGGSDFYATHFFIERILGRPDGVKYTIDVYSAIDMGICGLLAYRSILGGGKPVAIPNLRDRRERDKWRGDNACVTPEVAGDQLLPCSPHGDVFYPDEVYERVRKLWLAGKHAE